MLQNRLKDGDREALAQAYQLYFEKTYAFALKYTLSENIAADIVQDTFLKLWNNRSNISIELPLDQQLFVLAKNLIFDHFRKKIREEKILETYDDLKIASTDPWENEEREQRLKMVASAIEQLPQRQKEIFELAKFNGFTYEEISQKLNLSKHTISSHISAALKTLKKHIQIFLF